MKEFKEEISKVRVAEVKQSCSACPSSWVGKTDDGKEVYARYRWGFLRVTVNDEVVFGRQLRDDPPATAEEYQAMYDAGASLETVLSMMESEENLRQFCQQVGESEFSYHGSLDYATLVEVTKDQFVWPEECP
jgi:hypothetical protein